MDVVMLLLVGCRIVQQTLHHLLLAHAVLSHGRSELCGAVVKHLHCYVVYGPFVHSGYVLCVVVRHTLVHLYHLRLPQSLGDLAQGTPVFRMHVPESVQSPFGDLGTFRCPGGLGGEPGHLGSRLLLHAAELLCVGCRLPTHCLPQSTLALAAPHDFGGHELHVGHGGLGGGGGSAQLHLF
jgi:hypothetical protein